MKGAVGKKLYKPEADVEDMAEEADETVDTGPDALLGNAFDALQDGDREGFIRSLKAAMKE